MASSVPATKRISSEKPEHQELVVQINRIISDFEKRIQALESKNASA